MKEYMQEYIKDAPRTEAYESQKHDIDWFSHILMLPLYLGILALNLFIWIYLPYKVVSMLYNTVGFWATFGFVWVVLAVIYVTVD